MHTPYTRRAALAAAAFVLLAACDDQPTSPGARAAAAGAPAFTTAPSGARLIRNTVRYSDTGKKPSTGRAGSAAIAARALIGSDMVTELEVRAYPADTNRIATPSLQKVRVTALDYQGAPVFEANHTGLSGPTFTRTYTGLGWGQNLQLKANVTGIDPNRTDIVDATVPVLLRPDLAIFLWTTDRARVGEPFTTTAYVGEGNGQVGARADCVLYVDGARVDQALGIWVDAGGVVTCAFTHTFQTEGRKTVEVRVENVQPGDWSLENNAYASSILVVAADNFFTDASAHSSTTFTNSAWSYEWRDKVTGSGSVDSSAYTLDQWEQFALAYGGFDRGFSAPFEIQAEQTTSGRTVHAFTIPVDSMTPGYNCFSRFDGSAAATFYTCVVDTPYLHFTTFRYDRSAGAVTYHSASYSRAWDGGTGEVYEYHYNYDFASANGVRVEYGTDYAFSIRYVAADTTIATSISFPLRLQDHSAGSPEQFCSEYDDPIRYSKGCAVYEYRSSSLGGRWPDFPF